MSVLFFASVAFAQMSMTPIAPARVGVQNRTIVTGAPPNTAVSFYYGFVNGNTAVPNCPGVSVPIRNPRFVANRNADATGSAVLGATVPPTLSGQTLLLVAVSASTCQVSNTTVTAFPQVAWADVEPAFAASCSGCHYNAVAGFGGFQFSGPADLIGVPSSVPGMSYVRPFDTQNSYLMHKISGTQASVGGAGAQMNMPAASAALVDRWIVDGALP